MATPDFELYKGCQQLVSEPQEDEKVMLAASPGTCNIIRSTWERRTLGGCILPGRQ